MPFKAERASVYGQSRLNWFGHFILDKLKIAVKGLSFRQYVPLFRFQPLVRQDDGP